MPDSLLLHIPNLILTGNGLLSFWVRDSLLLDAGLHWTAITHRSLLNKENDACKVLQGSTWLTGALKHFPSVTHFYRWRHRGQRHTAICPRSQSKFRVESGLDSIASGLKLASLLEPCKGIQRREYGSCSPQAMQDGAPILPWHSLSLRTCK